MNEKNCIKFKCNVIVCGPAIGKTYLAEHDDRFIDLDEIKASYKYGLSNATRKEKEHGKLNRGKAIKSDSTEYAIKILEKELENNHIVLISNGNKKLLKYVIDNKIDYCLVYAGIDLFDEYAKRMKNRGNSDIFINKMTKQDIWEQFYIENKNDLRPKYKIELGRGQYLSDIKNKFI